MSSPSQPLTAESDTCSTIEAARLMGLAVRSVQLMVDRGELDAWKTGGGHRRIAWSSVQRWLAERQAGHPPRSGAAEPLLTPAASAAPTPPDLAAQRRPRVLLIEDSIHYQNLVRLVVAQKFPQVDLQVANDGIAGLAMAGQLQPQVLIVDILLPGIDGATLITSLRSHPQFAGSRLIVVTSLDEEQRAPYSFALAGVPVVHKPQLVLALPPLLEQAIAEAATAAPTPD